MSIFIFGVRIYLNESREEHILPPIQEKHLLINDFIVRCNK